MTSMEVEIARLVLGLIVWLLLCWAVARYADRKGRDGAGYFALSVFLSPLIGFAVVAALAPKPENLGMRKCPTCAEYVRAEALKCRFCGQPFRAPEGAEK